MGRAHLKEIESNLLGIDDIGNLDLSTVGKMAGQIALGNIPKFGGKGIPTDVTITNAAHASVTNACDVTFQVADQRGTAVAGIFMLDIWLSDAATGAGLTATTASGGIAADTSGGVVFGTNAAAKCLLVQTNSNGSFVLKITDTAKSTFYPCASLNTVSVVGAQLTTGSYR